MKRFKRYVVRDIKDRKIVDTIVVEVGKYPPKIGVGLYIAECIGRFDKP